jgi:hypothetical protein
VINLPKNVDALKRLVDAWLNETNSQNKCALKVEQAKNGFVMEIRNRGLANITFLIATLATDGYSIINADIVDLYNDPEGYSNILKIQLL